MNPQDWTFSAADLDALVSGEAPVQTTEEVAGPNEELIRLTRRIAGQHVEVIAGSLALSFTGKDSVHTDVQLAAAVENTLRLASACGNMELERELAALKDLLEGWKKRRPKGRATFLAALHDRVIQLCNALEEEDAQHLRRLVVFERRSLPLLDQLAHLPGIGARRLARLYSAGLFTIEAVSAADPREIAQTTGLPIKLAEGVVSATREFADAERRRAVEDLHRRSQELYAALRLLRPGRPEDRELLDMARSTLAGLSAALKAVDEAGEQTVATYQPLGNWGAE